MEAQTREDLTVRVVALLFVGLVIVGFIFFPYGLSQNNWEEILLWPPLTNILLGILVLLSLVGVVILGVGLSSMERRLDIRLSDLS